MSAALLIGSMLALSFLGIPLVFSILGASIATLYVFRPELPISIVAQTFIGGMEHYPLLAIALFFFAGELMNSGGITQRLVDFAASLVGSIKGGLAHVNILTSMLFAGISGSAVADSAAVGSVLIPSMKRAGYSSAFAAAVTQTSSVIGPIIPPSIPMIVFAVLAEVSVGEMFVAGVVPGVLVGLSLMAIAYVISRKRDYPSGDRPSLGVVTRAFGRAVVPLMAPIIIVGGILGGIFTATEAGAVAVLYCFLAGRFVLRELDLRATFEGMMRAAIGAATIMVIIGACSVFAWVVANLRISNQVADFLFSVSSEPWMILLMLNLFLLVLGLFLDPLPALIIVVPIFFPVATSIGIDPIHFGVIVVINLLIGLCTPPVGFLIYLTASIARCRPEEVIRESLPFLAVLFGVLMLCTFVPQIVLTLPDFVYR